MTQPTAYVPAVGFQAEETAAVAGRSTVRTSALDAELQAVSLTLSQILTNLALIQRDDTQLKDLVVTTASLSANVKALFAGGINPRGAWLTATAYAVKDVVETLSPLISYVCVIAHTSGTFATDRTAGKWMVLGSEPGLGTFTNIVLSTGGITLSTNNTQDLAATANRFRSGYFGTTVFVGTSVVTPLVGTITDAVLDVQVNNAIRWRFQTAAGNYDLYPGTSDNSESIGAPGARIKQLFTSIIDSGTTGSLSLKTNNGQTGFQVENIGGTSVNNLAAIPNITGQSVTLVARGTDSNITITYASKAGGSHNFSNDAGEMQFQVLRTASSTRNITVTGSNGGNPTIGVTAGNLAITPVLVLTSTLNFASAVGKILPGATSLSIRNAADTQDNLLISDAGSTVVRGTLSISAAGPVSAIFQSPSGGTIASANNLTVPSNAGRITGSVQINLLDSTGFANGSMVTLIFAAGAAPTLKHNQAASGAFKPMRLTGSVDFAATAHSAITFCRETNDDSWIEISRKVS